MQVYHKISTIQADLLAGKITCQQLVKHYIDRIKKQAELNAYLEIFEESAMQNAQKLDAKIADFKAGKIASIGRLAGCIVGIKDVLCYENHELTASSQILKGFKSLYSATAIERLLQEDAIIIGRLNCDEFAMGSTNENSAFGMVRNAYNTDKVSGGSSGGSAVAVQADLCLVALGTDTGGSVRQPASFCDVIGLKPTYGRVSRHGLLAYASSFDQIGIFGKNMDDIAMLLEIMAGKDDFDGTCSTRVVPKYSEIIDNELFKNKKNKIAYFENTLAHEGIDPEIRQQMSDFLAKLTADGHEIVPITFPYLEHIVPTYYILTAAEASSNLARYDGVHYGFRSENAANMEDVYRKTRSQAFGKEVQKRIIIGTFVLSSDYYDAYYAKAQKVRRLIKEATIALLETYDFILTPTTPTTAFDIGAKSKLDPISMYLEDIFTVQANLAGIPAISLPLFRHSNGLPFGLQLMTNKFEEEKLMGFGGFLMKKYKI